MVRTSRAVAVGALVSALIAGLSFLGGVVVALRYGTNLPLVAAIEPAGLQRSAPSAARDDFRVFWEVWGLVDQKFYHKEPLDYRKMTYGAIEGMLRSLGDDYTVFQEPETAQQAREDMSGQFEGIGAYVEFKDGKLLIVSPIEESPAERAGILAGDQVLKVDGVELAPQLEGLNPDEAAKRAASIIRGPKGTTVTLTIFRSSNNETFDLPITRDSIPQITVRGKIVGDNVAYIQISGFKETTTAELDKALAQLMPQQPASVILDLRNNPGGLLASSQEVLGRFVREGVALKEEFSDGSIKTLNIAASGAAAPAYDLPMIVLTNGGSASASEIVAGALRDHERATLVGEKTFGKGSVQSIEHLSDNSSARITIAQYLTPDGHEVHRKGIEPDVYVPLIQEEQYRVELPQRRPVDPAFADDSQLWWAIKLLTTEERPAFPTPTPTPDPAATATP
jgi:carboxyl-terminal processing protease